MALDPRVIEARIALRVAELRLLAAQTAMEFFAQRSLPNSRWPAPGVPRWRPVRLKEDAFAMVAVANAIERSDAVVITGNRFAIDDAGARAQTTRGHPQ
jgi:hypothetical protein